MRPLLRPTCLKLPLPVLSLQTLRRVTAAALTKPPDYSAETTLSPAQIPKLIISPGSVHHNSLPSFLEYASRVKLAPTRTVYVGTHYEYTSALALLRLGFSLLRIGKKADNGIDLIGHWVLPQLPEPLPVIVQCKALVYTTGPRHVRELQGAFQGIPPEWRGRDVLGLLVTTQKATKGVLEALGANRRPMGFVMISRTGTIEQFLWNRAASERGLEGVGVTVRHTPRILIAPHELEEQHENGCEGGTWKTDGVGTRRRAKRNALKWKNTGTKRDIQLTWMGKPIFPDRAELDEETMRLTNEIIDGEEGLKSKAKKAHGRKRAGSMSTSKRKVMTAAAATSVKRGRGRPKGSKNKATIAAELATTLPGGRGRSKGSTNKGTAAAAVTVTPRKRGRPKGSKNKPKADP